MIQSFEVANLKYVRAKLGRSDRVRLMQLTSGEPAGLRPADVVKTGDALTYCAMMAPAGLAEVARYADILSSDARSIIPLGRDGRLTAPSAVTADAHRAGLQVIPYTFRPENHFLAADFRDAAAMPRAIRRARWTKCVAISPPGSMAFHRRPRAWPPRDRAARRTDLGARLARVT